MRRQKNIFELKKKRIYLRFVLKNIKRCSAYNVAAKRAQKCPLLHYRAARGIYKKARRFHHGKARIIHEILRGRHKRDMQAHIIYLRQKLLNGRTKFCTVIFFKRFISFNIIIKDGHIKTAHCVMRNASANAPDTDNAKCFALNNRNPKKNSTPPPPHSTL